MNNILTRSSAFCILLAFLVNSQAVYADSPSFTYLELEYVAAGEIEVADDSLSVSVDLDGYAFNASAELGIFLLQASRFELDSDELLNSNLEDSISTIAIGLTFELPQTAIYGLVRGRRDELSVSGGQFDNENEDANSVGLEAGVRVNLTDRFEVNANIGTPNIDEGTSYGVGAQFYITKNLGLTFDYKSIEVDDERLNLEFQTSSIGLRYNF